MDQVTGLTFVDLPKQARRAIYASSGLVRPCPIDLLDSRGREDDAGSRNISAGCWYRRRLGGVISSFQPGARLCACPPLPLGLLLVCRQVGEEALDVLLQANRFVLRARHGRPDMLAPLLESIPAPHLSRMANLLVRLNGWPCPWGHDETYSEIIASGGPPRPGRCRLCRTDLGAGDPVLSASEPASLRMLDAWEQACRRLGSGRRPGQLNLTLICDVDPSDDCRAASCVVAPLTQYLPRLKSCTIRLGRSPNDVNSARIARETSLALTGDEPYPSTKPFPFGRLPWELKLRILRYTDLGPPDVASYDAHFEHLQIVNGRLLKGELVSAFTRRVRKCCFECTATFMDCCCSNFYAAFAPGCSCRILPTALFQVNRDLHRAAIETFYPSARFTLRNDDLGSILNFLSPTATSFLRHMNIALTAAQCYYWKGQAPIPPHPAWHFDQVAVAHFPHLGGERPGLPRAGVGSYRDQFRAVLARLAGYADLSRLHLEVDLRATLVFADLSMGDMEESDDDLYRWTYDLYVSVAEAVCSVLGGLSGVRFRLGTFTDLEPWLEREVLGERFLGSVGRPAEKERPRILEERVPRYHRTDRRLGGSHYRG